MGPNKQRRKTAQRKARQAQRRRESPKVTRWSRPDLFTSPALSVAAAAMLALPKRPRHEIYDPIGLPFLETS